MKIGDKIKVVTKTKGNKLCEIDSVSERKIHFKNKSGVSLTVNTERIRQVSKSWRGANFEYVSFN
jgi:hypothetical protein